MKLKRIIAALLCAVMVVVLCGCALTEESGFESTLSAIKEAESVKVYTYGDDEKVLEIEKADVLAECLAGSWEVISSYKEGGKVLTVSLGEHHEITFFDNGTAVIYYGFATILEKDRCYYNVTLDDGLENLLDWCIENGVSQNAEQ